MMAAAGDCQSFRRVAVDRAQRVRRQRARQLDLIERSRAIRGRTHERVELEGLRSKSEPAQQPLVFVTRAARQPGLGEQARCDFGIDRHRALTQHKLVVALEPRRFDRTGVLLETVHDF